MRDPQAGTKTGPIAKIQQKLIDAGIMNPIPDTSYGIYGPKTAAAVKKFQEKQFPNNPKEWDGVVGPKTTAELDKLVTVDDFDFKVDYGSNMPGMSTYVAGADREDIEQRLNYMMLQTPQKQDQQTMNKITSKEPESDEGWFQYIRKGFPNVVQLIKCNTTIC
jgi:peptidoglycan hydrolase-like protein with peptidoglycan-binding domain